MTDTELTRRLEKLERENRRLKRGGFALLVMLVALATIYATRPITAVGQNAGASKFNKLWKPEPISNMDWMLLQAQVDVVRQSVPSTSGVYLPSLYYDSGAGKIGAIAFVDGKYLESHSTKSVRDALEQTVTATLISLVAYFPDVTRRDLEMEFRCFDTGNKAKRNEPGRMYYIFAEYRNGELTLR